MKKKVILTIIEILAIVLIFVIDNYLVTYVSYIQSHTFDIRPSMAYGMVVRPLLFLVVGILTAFCLRQFVKIIGNKVLFIVAIGIIALLFLPAFLYDLPTILNLLFGVEIQLGISEFIFRLLGMTYINFLLRYAAYFYVALGIVVGVCYSGKKQIKTTDFIELEN